MTKFRRALIALLIFFGVAAVSLGGGIATAVATPFVDIGTIKTCLPDGWKVDYTAGSFGSSLPWKVRTTTPDWLPWINTYQAVTIPFTRSTGVLPFSQATTPPVKIDVQWTNGAQATDTEGAINRPAGCVAPPTTTTTTTTTAPTTTTTTIPATTTTVTTVPETTIVEVTTTVTDPGIVVAPETTTPTEFPVTGKGDGGLFIGGLFVGAGMLTTWVARRPKKA